LGSTGKQLEKSAEFGDQQMFAGDHYFLLKPGGRGAASHLLGEAAPSQEKHISIIFFHFPLTILSHYRMIPSF
jgi:hypothetical protein